MRTNKKKQMRKKNAPSQGVYALTGNRSYSSFQKAGFSFLDPHMYVTLKYSDLYSVSMATIVGTQQIMNLNSVFDPDRTGTGHQPYGFDQLAALYFRYRVLGVRWKIVFSAEAFGFKIVVIPVNGLLSVAISTATTFVDACEAPRSVVHAQGTGAQAVVINGNISLNDLNGCTPTEYLADDRFESVCTASPSEVMTLYTGLYNPSASTVVVDFTVELWYHVDFHDPIILGPS